MGIDRAGISRFRIITFISEVKTNGNFIASAYTLVNITGVHIPAVSNQYPLVEFQCSCNIQCTSTSITTAQDGKIIVGVIQSRIQLRFTVGKTPVGYHGLQQMFFTSQWNSTLNKSRVKGRKLIG